MSDPQKSAQKAFNELSFFILTGLGKGADVGVDGKLWQVNQFSGFKLLPPGLHLFVYSASPSSHSAPDTISSGIGVRHGLLKFFGKGETIVESWDNVEEELEDL
ncbi:A1 cistron-splicing factor AAR2, partial [Pseudohyphozyma bogoriensis]